MKVKSFILLVVLSVFNIIVAKEGMIPMSELSKINLKARGLEVSSKDIYNPGGVSLVDAIVKINGCTGSFVSDNGLIFTNHHCAFHGVQAASTKENDYLQNGFYAKTFEDELPAKGYTVRITEWYKDVSKEVLSVVKKGMKPADKTKAIERKIKEIVAKTEKENAGKRAEVSEMFIGKTYVLYLYTYLKDVRLVYVPPISIGNYGGETDNWIWPRHTGDFSFMRVYTAPDGTPAEYSKDNVPYHPKTVMEIAVNGLSEGDSMFIFGYPGRTYRNRTSYFIEYLEKVRMPFIADFYEWQINLMEKAGENDRAIALKLSSRIKGLANVMKNYRGKLLGLKRLRLVDKKRTEERKLQEFINSDIGRLEKFGNLLEKIEDLYGEEATKAERDLILTYLKRSCLKFSYAYTAYEGSIELAKDDLDREPRYMKRNLPMLEKRLKLSVESYFEPVDKAVLKNLLQKAAKLPPALRIKPLDEFVSNAGGIDKFVEQAYMNGFKIDADNILKMMNGDEKSLRESSDTFIKLAIALYPEYKNLQEEGKVREGKLTALQSKLFDIKKEFSKEKFIPDANGTLRFTSGQIKGYYPRDAVYYYPITTLKGVIEKNRGRGDFNAPAKLMKLYETNDFGSFTDKKTNTIPVDILYDADTTGGNSGSPIMNKYGQLAGINFDRAYEATINDFAWSEDYSRSIGVDIRYVLFILEKYSNADNLLKELKVK
jgi:hypothetical protein